MTSAKANEFMNETYHKWINQPHDNSRKKDIVNFYNDFAESYFMLEEYRGPAKLVENVRPFVENKSGLTILDVGAGTGEVALRLKEFLPEPVQFDAVEPSVKMIEKAPAGLYTKVYFDYMEGLNSTSIPTGGYDLVCATGVFVPGHIPSTGLYELCRIAKIGGLVAVSLRDSYLTDADDYKDWYPTIDKLESDGCWEPLHRTQYEGHYQNYTGMFFLFKKLKDV